jgi:hypothetical protein
MGSQKLQRLAVVVALAACAAVHVAAAPAPPAPCGTLDLTSPLTQHCFPEDGEGMQRM